MKLQYVLILAGALALSGCKTNKMAAVEPDVPVIEKDTEMEVEVDRTSGIMSMEESFTFTDDEDKNIHDQKSYFVIIGSFRRIDNARRFEETLKSKGFQPVILLSENGLHRVSVDSFNSENDARTRIMQIRNNYSEHADTWLLVRK